MSSQLRDCLETGKRQKQGTTPLIPTARALPASIRGPWGWDVAGRDMATLLGMETWSQRCRVKATPHQGCIFLAQLVCVIM